MKLVFSRVATSTPHAFFRRSKYRVLQETYVTKIQINQILVPHRVVTLRSVIKWEVQI